MQHDICLLKFDLRLFPQCLFPISWNSQSFLPVGCFYKRPFSTGSSFCTSICGATVLVLTKSLPVRIFENSLQVFVEMYVPSATYVISGYHSIRNIKG